MAVSTVYLKYQTVADGIDHIDPAQLRGLGPIKFCFNKWYIPLVNINGLQAGRGSVEQI
jgi:hypothetical protein